jgi:hypothetical protein
MIGRIDARIMLPVIQRCQRSKGKAGGEMHSVICRSQPISWDLRDDEEGGCR